MSSNSAEKIQNAPFAALFTLNFAYIYQSRAGERASKLYLEHLTFVNGTPHAFIICAKPWRRSRGRQAKSKKETNGKTTTKNERADSKRANNRRSQRNSRPKRRKKKKRKQRRCCARDKDKQKAGRGKETHRAASKQCFHRQPQKKNKTVSVGTHSHTHTHTRSSRSDKNFSHGTQEGGEGTRRGENRWAKSKEGRQREIPRLTTASSASVALCPARRVKYRANAVPLLPAFLPSSPTSHPHRYT